jgi:hypothetical protein
MRNLMSRNVIDPGSWAACFLRMRSALIHSYQQYDNDGFAVSLLAGFSCSELSAPGFLKPGPFGSS